MWIEIPKLSNILNPCSVTPYAGVWTEILKLQTQIEAQDGKLFNACTYYVFKKEIYFINLNHSILNEYFLGISSNANLSIPVPFHAGDIVETNLAPFAGKKKMIILETGYNVDCCCLQALYQNEDGLWDIGAVKIRFID